jgi:N-acetyl-gamma-glutamylphosphate reductase
VTNKQHTDAELKAIVSSTFENSHLSQIHPGVANTQNVQTFEIAQTKVEEERKKN